MINKINIICNDHYGNKHSIPTDQFIWRVSAYGLLERDNKILMVQERWMKTWEFPGGGVHVNESIEQGLIREFYEETGINVEIVETQHAASLQPIAFQEGYFYSGDHNQAWHTLRFLYRVKSLDKAEKLLTAGKNTRPAILQFLKRI